MMNLKTFSELPENIKEIVVNNGHMLKLQYEQEIRDDYLLIKLLYSRYENNKTKKNLIMLKEYIDTITKSKRFNKKVSNKKMIDILNQDRFSFSESGDIYSI